jgi:hypothetical protein
MKVSTIDDNSVIIQCENFEAGREPFLFPRPTSTEFVYLFFILTITYLSGFNPLEFLVNIELSTVSYWENHPCNSIVYWATFLIFFASMVDNLFFKKFVIRRDRNYQIDRDSCFSAHPPYSLIQKIERISYEDIFKAVSTIHEIDMVEDFKIGVTYDEDSGSSSAYAIKSYKIVVELDAGKSSTIESNSIDTLRVGSSNQIAFCELIAETQTAVEQIKKFLEVSKNKITPSSN